MTSDNNKGISQIVYNQYNLPTFIKKDATNYIIYEYDGQGTKLKKTVVEGAVTTTTEYLGEFVYTTTGTTTDFFLATSEGRIVNLTNKAFGSAETYEYTYKDHLGNARLSYRQNTPATTTTLLTAEDANLSAEQGKFDNLTPTVIDGTAAAPKGYRSDKSVKLNSSYRDPADPTNLQKYRKVGNLTAAKRIDASASKSVKVSVRATLLKFYFTVVCCLA